MACACNLSTWSAEAGGLMQVQGQPEPHRETLSHKKIITQRVLNYGKKRPIISSFMNLITFERKISGHLLKPLYLISVFLNLKILIFPSAEV